MKIEITEKAARVFLETCESQNIEFAFLRIGANPGGCSGWKYELETTNEQQEDDLLFETNNVSVLVNQKLLEEVIGPVTVDYSTENLVEQGFVFYRKDGMQCGCGESFTPYKEKFEKSS